MNYSMARSNKPHAVCTPYPAQGHIAPMLKLAKLLHHRGFHITFVNTEYNHKRLLRSQGSAALNGLPDFRFETIPDGLPPSDIFDVTQDLGALTDSVRKNCLAPYRCLLAKLSDQVEVPAVTCVVSDVDMAFSVDAAKEIGVPAVLFLTTSACALLSLAYTQYRNLLELRDFIPFKGKDERYLTNGHSKIAMDWIRGIKYIGLKNLPNYIRAIDPNSTELDVIMGELERASRASAIVLNTFYALESKVLDAYSSVFPRVLSIGPLQLLLNQITPNPNLKSIGSNLWKEQSECLEWLDSNDIGSVVYVNFGSAVVISREQLIEIAWGLANSKKTFLWITRPDLVNGDDSSLLPAEFFEEIEGRSLLARWCNQEKVLSHPSIGGFLTHCGWNSTLESICSGVPMICWPFFHDQPANCKYACTEWGIGMEIDANVKRNEVEKVVKELMDGEKGKKMKKKAMEWKDKAMEAVDSLKGSSYLNFDELVKEVLLSENVG